MESDSDKEQHDMDEIDENETHELSDEPDSNPKVEAMDKAKQENEEVSVKPNPSNGLFYVELIDVEEEEIFIDIFSLNGQVVYSASLKNDDSLNKIDLTEYKEGVYFYKIQGETIQSVGKMMIK